ncbi:MAG: hypothetical protein OEY14_18865, partial [Myxococcales bacterium]|nr:hypothetical protein [Myxococcales bacterium]
GPALFLGAESSAPPVGYVSPRVRVQLRGAPVGDRVEVRINGPMKVKAWLGVSRLAARVQRRGGLRGTPAYLGPGDLVRVLGPEGDRMRLEVAPDLLRGTERYLGPFVGTFPTVGLGVTDPQGAEPPRPGSPRALPMGQAVPVYERPGGAVVATLPALNPPLVIEVIREQGGWAAIRAGHGPYLVGYVNVPLSAAERSGLLLASLEGGSGGVPARVQAEEGHPLWAVPAGARVRRPMPDPAAPHGFRLSTFAILAQAGYARELDRPAEYPGMVDVFVAAGDELAVRGLLPESDLRPAPSSAPPVAPAAHPEP